MRRYQFLCTAFLIFLVSLANAQVPLAHNGELALAFPHIRAEESSNWFVDYVRHGGEPTFRLLVHHFHADCTGYLYIGKTKLAYVPTSTAGPSDAFEISRSELKDSSPRFSGFRFALPDKTQQFAFLSEPTNHTASQQDAREQLMLFVELMMTDFDSAQAEFGRIAAGWQQTFVSPATAAHNTGPPVTKFFSPNGVTDGALVDAGTDSLKLIGLVAQATPVRAVLINGQLATTQPLAANILEFQSSPMQLQSATTSLNVLTISDSGQSQLSFSVRKPTIAFASTALYTPDPTIAVKGTLTGFGEVERVEVGGEAATLTRTADNSVAFVTPGVPVNPGKNTLQGTITNANGSLHPFSVVVERRPRLSLDFVRRAIHTLSRARLTELVDEYGVDFRLDEDKTKLLRAAGADQSLLDAIRDASP